MRWIATIAGVLGIGIVGYPFAVDHGLLPGKRSDAAASSGNPLRQFRFARMRRGNVVRFVVASARLDAVVTVKVSSQLSGQVAELLVDFNHRVRRGQPLARLDHLSFAAKVKEAEARLAHARAALRQAQAELGVAQIRLRDARNDLRRKRGLAVRNVLSRREMEKSLAHHAEARRKLQAMAAQRDLRTSDIDVATALLSQAKINLSRTVIRAPIDGIVIERNVDLGQTVAASLQAPTLFTIAQDLRRMELKTFVDEADIGVVRKGQRVVFRVDAFPGRYFEGRVTSIRKSPKVVQNVTVYTVIVSAKNPAGILLPGMTATTRIVVAARRNVRRLPLASLRFSPRRKDEAGEAPKRRDGKRRIWRLSRSRLEPVFVRTGARDATHVEIVGGSLKEGDRIAVGWANPAESGGVRHGAYGN